MIDGVDPLPDLAELDDAALRQLIDDYVAEEQQVSYRRRILHGYIDILRSELISRRKDQFDSGELGTIDIEALSRILAGKSLPGEDD